MNDKPLLPEVILQSCIVPNKQDMTIALEAMMIYGKQEANEFLKFYQRSVYIDKVQYNNNDEIYNAYVQYKQQ